MLRAVKLTEDSKGEIVTLAPDCIVTIKGESTVAGFIEIVCNGEPLSAFAEDVLERGIPVKPAHSETEKSDAGSSIRNKTA